MRAGTFFKFATPAIVEKAAVLRNVRKYRNTASFTCPSVTVLWFRWKCFSTAGGCRGERLLACRSMAHSEVPVVASPADPNRLVERAAGLHRNLTPRQLSMIAVGGAIGTGLFLGSALSVQLAGPGVILSYIAAAGIALTLMWALGEMTIAHPVAGSFGVDSELYVNPWAGFAMRYSYWLGQVIAIGSEMVAASIYCKHWFPGIPSWVWIAGFSVALIWVNASGVSNFGTF